MEDGVTEYLSTDKKNVGKQSYTLWITYQNAGITFIK